MARLAFSLLLVALLAALAPNVHAGPACACRNQGNDSCVTECSTRWGWPGKVMGSDRWGSVMTNSGNTDVRAAVTRACRAKHTSQPTATAASNTTAPAAVGNVASAPPSSSPIPLPSILSTSSSSSPLSSVHSTAHSLVAQSHPTPSNTPSSTPAPPTSTPEAPTTHAPQTTQAQTTAAPLPPPSTHSASPAPSPSPSSSEAPASSPAASPAAGSSSSGSTSSSDINAYLTAHNTVRAQHGASALSWSNDLAAKAQQWANGCVFQHSGGSLGPFGENLAAGTGSSYDIAAAVKSWTDEVSQYDASNPQPSHFTQVVWKATTTVGCAVQSCSGIFDASFGPAKFFVCEYSPQGNVIGEFAQNVQA